MNFLVIGGGSIGKRHIKNLFQLGYTSVFCLRRSLDAAFEKETGAKVITAIAELQTQIHGVIVCSPTSLHNQGLNLSMSLGSAVLMEKPLIHSAEGLKEAELLMRKMTHPFFIGFMLRYHPLVKKIKDALESGLIGQVYSARFEFGSYLPYWHPWEDHRIGYAARKDLGGGVINTITHELDLIQYFFGSPGAVSCISKNLKKLDIEVEEIADSIFEYPDKVVTLHLDYLQKDYNREIKILGEHGSITWNWHDNGIRIARHKENPIEQKLEKAFDVNQLYLDELADFVAITRDQVQHHPLDGRHAMENTRIMLAMHESASTRQSVKLTKV
jgi:predicted dehydrogenase